MEALSNLPSHMAQVYWRARPHRHRYAAAEEQADSFRKPHTPAQSREAEILLDAHGFSFRPI